MNEQTKRGAIAPATNFALGFQPDGVQLLQRQGDAWVELDRASFFGGDLRAAMGGFVQRLRAANAPGLALVIPGDQILYTDLALPQAADIQAALRAGLDGLTPYRVEDLAFDYAPADAAPGGSVKVAAVARQTLQEAEDFAVRHGFAPDRFVAAPKPEQFPHAPDFGATELAAEWARAAVLAADLISAEELAADLAQADDADFAALEQPVAPAMVAVAAASVPAGPAISRITRHIVDAAPSFAVPTEQAASVNVGTIVLPGEEVAPPTVAPATVTEATARPATAESPAARPEKVLPDRARAFHERAQAARQVRPPLAAPARNPAAPGRRSGLSGALPMVGLLVLGLGIAAAISNRDSAPEPVPQTTQVAPPVQQPDPVATPVPAQPVAAAPAAPAPAAPVTTPTAAAPATVATGPAVPVPDAAAVVQAVTPPEVLPGAAPAPSSTAQSSAPSQPAPAAIAPVAPPQAAISAASDLLRQAPAPAVAETPAPVPETAQPSAPAATRPAVASSVRPKSRPADLARVRAPAAEPARTTTAAPSRSTAAPAARPASRPAAAEPAARASASRSPGAPDSSTLRSSARPKTAPSRSSPAQASAAPDARPAVPRNPQPYERRAQPEPTGSRPPPKPAGSSNQGAVLHLQPAPVRLTMFTQAGHAAMLARLDQPLAVRQYDSFPLIRTAQARPSKKPTRSDAVDDAVAAAMGSDRPAARASTAAPAAAAPRRAASEAGLGSSNRPRHRPSGLASAGSASTAGLSAATNAAVEEAIASAVSSSSAVPGRVALTALSSSARPLRRGNAPVAATESGGGAAGQEGTLAPVPDDGAASKAAAEAAALAERRRLDDELQRQAEQRARNRASADAQAAAQAKAAAEARARAQAEAEAAAAARKNQRYRPPEVDNEPDVAAAPSGPTSGSVASAATNRGIDLNATQLIGTVGAGKASRGLIRLRNGKIVTVRLGDKINGGQITQIGNGGLQYVKSGKQYSLPILNGR